MSTNRISSVRMFLELQAFDCPPSDLDVQLGATADEYWVTGESRPFDKRQRRKSYSGWRLNGMRIDSYDVGEHLVHLLDRVPNLAPVVQQLPSTVGVLIYVTVFVTEDDSTPGLHLDSTLMDRLTACRASLDISIAFA